jgi:hypothetical protein
MTHREERLDTLQSGHVERTDRFDHPELAERTDA